MIFNQVNLADTWKIYWDSVGGAAGSFFGLYLFGALFAQIQMDTGGGRKMANVMMKGVSKISQDSKTQRLITIGGAVLITTILTMGGISIFVSIFMLIPIFAAAFEKCNIPRRFIPATIFSGVSIGSCAPGSPQLGNFIPTSLAGVSAAAGIIPGIVGSIVIFVLCMWYFKVALKKSLANGETFEWGRLSARTDDENLPNFWLAFLPLVLVFCLFNFFKIDLSWALLYGSILAMILMFKYFPRIKDKNGELRGRLWDIVETLSGGARQAALAIMCFPAFGIGAVVTATPSYAYLCQALLSIPGPAVIACSILLILCVLVCCNPVAGMQFAVPIAMENFVPLGVTASAIGRIGSFAAEVLDSLPWAAGMPIMMDLSDVKMKDGYPPVLWTTVIATGIGTIVITIMYAIWPNIP